MDVSLCFAVTPFAVKSDVHTVQDITGKIPQNQSCLALESQISSR